MLDRRLEGQWLDVAFAAFEGMADGPHQLLDRDHAVVVAVAVLADRELVAAECDVDHRDQLGDADGLVVVAVAGAAGDAALAPVRAVDDGDDEQRVSDRADDHGHLWHGFRYQTNFVCARGKCSR